MELTGSLTERQWRAASNLAIALVESQDRTNSASKGLTTELNKVIAYLRACQVKGKTPQLSNYLTALVSNGKNISHGKDNTPYYEAIKDGCNQHLKEYLNGEDIVTILGWSCRLMRYYQNGGPVGEVREQLSARQEEIKIISQSQSFSVGQIVDAKVTNKTEKKKRVTYEIAGAIKLTENNSKGFDKVSVGQAVKVKVTKVENKVIKSVKYEGLA